MAQAPNRPVKSESDREGDREFTLEEKIRLQLIESGERDRLKRLLREKLEQCGWRDHIKQLCKDYVAKHRGEEITAEEIVKAIRPEGRASVPDSVKAELLAHIKSFIVSI